MNIQKNLPPDLKKLIRYIQSQHFLIYLVGGCVRDMLLKHEISDYDLCTNAPIEEMITLLQSANYKIIKTGIQHGTITIILNDDAIELTTFRKENEYLNHRFPKSITYSQSLIEDLSRRDFTMNAIAYDQKEGFIDPFNGLEDIKNHIITCVNNPEKRIEEDALRILRALRFQLTLNFSIAKETYLAIQKHATSITYLSKERIQQEFNKILLADHSDTIKILYDANVLSPIIDHQPSELLLKNLLKRDKILNHTASYPLSTKLAILFQNIAKINGCSSKTLAISSSNITQIILKKLHYSKKIIKITCHLITFQKIKISLDPAALRILAAKFNHDFNFLHAIIHLQIANIKAKENSKSIQYLLSCSEKIKEMQTLNQFITPSELAINGNDLKALGYHGEQIKTILNTLYMIVLKEPQLNQISILLKKIV